MSSSSTNSYVALSATALYYPRPHNRRILNTVTVTAVGDRDLLFKVKGVKPDPYHVRPKTDVLCAGQSVEIHFTRAPTEGVVAPVNEGFVLEVAPLPLNMDVRSVQGNKEQVKAAFDQVPKETIQKAVRLESIFNISESEIPRGCKVSSLTEQDGGTAGRGRDLSPSSARRGVSTASVVSTATSAASSPVPASSPVAKAAEATSERQVQGELAGLKGSVKDAKTKLAVAEGASQEHQSYAKSLNAAGNSGRGTAAPVGAAKANSSEVKVPVSVVVLLMLLTYGLGLVCRQTYGPASQWLS